MTSAAVTWVSVIDLRPTNPHRLVSVYTDAAGEDSEVGLMGFVAGLTPDELTEGLASGRCSRPALAALAGLRSSPLN